MVATDYRQSSIRDRLALQASLHSRLDSIKLKTVQDIWMFDRHYNGDNCLIKCHNECYSTDLWGESGNQWLCRLQQILVMGSMALFTLYIAFDAFHKPCKSLANKDEYKFETRLMKDKRPVNVVEDEDETLQHICLIDASVSLVLLCQTFLFFFDSRQHMIEWRNWQRVGWFGWFGSANTDQKWAAIRKTALIWKCVNPSDMRHLFPTERIPSRGCVVLWCAVHNTCVKWRQQLSFVAMTFHRKSRK